MKKSLNFFIYSKKHFWEKTWETKDWAEVLKRELHNFTTRATVDTFVNQCCISEGQNVLDVGCGYGRIINGLLHEVSNISVTGIDLSKAALEYGKYEVISAPSDVTFIAADAEKLPFHGDKFDCAVSTQTFQHIAKPEIAIKEIKRCLKPSGKLIIMVPNKWNPLKYLMYKRRLLTVRCLKNWLVRSGLDLGDSGTVAFFPPSVWNFDEDSIMMKFERLLAKIPLVNFIGGLVWVTGIKRS